jgi:hypothetical protein
VAIQTIKSGLTLKNDAGGTITYNITLDDQTSEWRISATEYTQADGTQLTIPANADIFRQDKFAGQAVQDFFDIDNDQLVELEQALMTEVTSVYNSGNSAALPNYQTPYWATPQTKNPDGTSTLYQTPFTSPKATPNTPASPQNTNQFNWEDLLDKIGLGDFGQNIDKIFDTQGNLLTVGENFKYSSGTSTSDTLIYPLALGQLQSQIDTCVIQQFTYVAPNQEEFINQASNTVLQSGMLLDGEKEGRYKQSEGMVILPMPQSFEEKRGVQYGEDTMNTLAAGLTQNVIKNPGAFLGSALTGATAGALLGGGIPSIGLGGIGGGARTGIALKALADVGGNLTGTTDGQTLLSTVMSSNILKAAGVNVSAESILARGAGIVPNPNMELLFRSPLLRNFGLVYRMTARSEDEAKMIRRIIRFFKQGMSPRTDNTGNSNYFLKTPNVFGVSFQTSNEENISMPKFKTCALRGFTTDYAPDKMWAAYDGGQPVSVTIVLEFGELTPIYSSDYDGLADDVIGY